MKQAHSDWIREYRESVNWNTAGKCHAACKAMLREFPSLTMVRGHVHCFRQGIRERGFPHWWMTDADGSIIDPTDNQFDNVIAYEPHDEGAPEPTGLCPNCGGYCYDSMSVCSDACGNDYVGYLNGAWRSSVRGEEF